MKFLLLLTFFSSLVNASSIKQLCGQMNGTFYEKYTCPKSKLRLRVDTCEVKNDREEVLFFNGCSGPAGGFKDIFTQPCINHDHCYHHEPATTGYTQKDCDIKLRDEMLMACSQLPPDQNHKKCEKWANIMYRALRIVGGIAFQCDNSYAHY